MILKTVEVTSVNTTCTAVSAVGGCPYYLPILGMAKEFLHSVISLFLVSNNPKHSASINLMVKYKKNYI